jgi:hypothetical protein
MASATFASWRLPPDIIEQRVMRVVFGILEDRLYLRYAGLVAWSLLDIAEDGPLRPLLIPLQKDAIRAARDDELINLRERREPILERVVCQRESHHKEDRAADKVLAFIECKLLAAQM